MKNQRLPVFFISGPTTTRAIMMLSAAARNVVRWADLPVMVSSWVPASTSGQPSWEQASDTASPTADDTPPTITSTFSWPMSSRAPRAPMSALVASSRMRTSMRRPPRIPPASLSSSTASWAPAICDAPEAANVPERESTMPSRTGAFFFEPPDPAAAWSSSPMPQPVRAGPPTSAAPASSPARLSASRRVRPRSSPMVPPLGGTLGQDGPQRLACAGHLFEVGHVGHVHNESVDTDLDQLAGLGGGGVDVLDREQRGLGDLGRVAADVGAVAFEDVELVPHPFGVAEDVAGVAVARHQPQRAPLPAPADEDRDPAPDRLRVVEHLLHPVVAALERRRRLGEHGPADLEGLLEAVEALAGGREVVAVAGVLVVVPGRPDPEDGPAGGDDVEGGDDLGQQRRVAVGDAGHHRAERRPRRAGGEGPEQRVGLEHRVLLRPDHPDLVEVVHHPDRVEAVLLGGGGDAGARLEQLGIGHAGVREAG